MKKARRILVVEDDEDLSKLLSLTLAAEGYQVDSARDGREAIRYVRESLPDLLILDLMIPFIDGYHVAQEILYDKTLSKKPKILVITGRDIEKEKNLIDFVGANGILPKPFSNKDLKTTVARILQ